MLYGGVVDVAVGFQFDYIVAENWIAGIVFLSLVFCKNNLMFLDISNILVLGVFNIDMKLHLSCLDMNCAAFIRYK